jgi:hypothetical protein
MSANGKKDWDDDESIDDDELMNLGNNKGKGTTLFGDKKGTASVNPNFSDS